MSAKSTCAVVLRINFPEITVLFIPQSVSMPGVSTLRIVFPGEACVFLTPDAYLGKKRGVCIRSRAHSSDARQNTCEDIHALTIVTKYLAWLMCHRAFHCELDRVEPIFVRKLW